MNTQQTTSKISPKFANHTPGPWIAKPDQGKWGTYHIAKIRKTLEFSEWSKQRVAEDEANARLISAAPDLLDALNLLVGTLEVMAVMPTATGKTSTLEMTSPELDKAKAAIAKATGAEAA